jgi:hypothetical protein
VQPRQSINFRHWRNTFLALFIITIGGILWTGVAVVDKPHTLSGLIAIELLIGLVFSGVFSACARTFGKVLGSPAAPDSQLQEDFMEDMGISAGLPAPATNLPSTPNPQLRTRPVEDARVFMAPPVRAAKPPITSRTPAGTSQNSPNLATQPRSAEPLPNPWWWRLMLLGLPVYAVAFLVRDLVSWKAGGILIWVALGMLVVGFTMFSGSVYMGDAVPSSSADRKASAAGSFVAVLTFILAPQVLQSVLVAQASNGSAKAISSAGWGPAGSPADSPAAYLGSRLCLIGLASFLIIVPQVLRWHLPWKRAKDARVTIPRWLAAFAAAATWLYVFLLHFEGGPLAGIAPAPLAVLAFGGAALFVPLYASTAKTFWRRGVENVMDPVGWLAAWQRLREEFRSKT